MDEQAGDAGAAGDLIEYQPCLIGLGQAVAIMGGNERGLVVERTESLLREPTYLVRYVSASGCASEVWWGQSALTLVAEDDEPEAAEQVMTAPEDSVAARAA